jgi:nucleoside-diphosphate-sugar epimerase
MRVLVTGGTGFVGGWSAKAISDAGHEVRFLVRRPERLFTSTAELGIDVSDHVMGDITDADSVKRALSGCDAVVHAAAMVSTDPKQADKTMATNLEGAHNVLGQAVDLGLDSIVHVSSIAALFRPGLEKFEADLPPAGGTEDGYGQSKARVELYARELQESGAPVNITYPGMVLGPPVGEQYGEAAEGVRGALQVRSLPGRSAAWLVVDVRDLGTLHAALLEPGRGPRRYIAGGHRLSVGEVAQLLSEVSGTTVHPIPIPDSFLRAAGAALDQLGRFLPLNSAFSEAGMQYYTQMPDSDDSPSERELGVVYRDPRETLADTVAAMRQG